jgi:hypothetical protein
MEEGGWTEEEGENADETRRGARSKNDDDDDDDEDEDDENDGR